MAVGALAGWLAPAQASEVIRWRSSLDSALTEAGKKSQPVMVDFYTDWCGWCKRLDATTYQDASVGAACRDLVCVKVNAEKERGIAQRFSVMSYPTIVFLDSSGEFVDHIVGYLPPDGFRTKVGQVLESDHRFHDLSVKISSSTDPSVLRQYAEECLQRQRPREAASAIRRLESASKPDAPGLDDLTIQLGYLWGSTGQLTQAVECGNRVLTRYGKGKYTEAAHFLVGAADYDLKNAADAKKHLRWVAEKGNDPQLRPRAEGMLAQLDPSSH